MSNEWGHDCLFYSTTVVNKQSTVHFGNPKSCIPILVAPFGSSQESPHFFRGQYWQYWPHFHWVHRSIDSFSHSARTQGGWRSVSRARFPRNGGTHAEDDTSFSDPSAAWVARDFSAKVVVLWIFLWYVYVIINLWFAYVYSEQAADLGREFEWFFGQISSDSAGFSV